MNEKYQEFYDYLKSENLTDLDAESFQIAYSEPEKFNELWGYISEQNLTDLTRDEFFDSYFSDVKKKDTASVSEPGSLVSPELEVPVETAIAPATEAAEPATTLTGAADPDFFEERMEMISPQLIDRGDEDEVAQELTDVFKPYGFEVEPAGIGDAIKVTAGNGKSIEVDLDPFEMPKILSPFGLDFNTKTETAEAKKLQDFLRENRQEGLDAPRRFVTNKQRDDEVKRINQKQKEINRSAQDYLKRKLEFQNKYPQFLTYDPEYIKNNPEEYQRFLNDIDSLEKEREFLVEIDQKAKEEGAQLDRLAGEYTEMLAQRGYWSGGVFYNEFIQGVAEIAAGAKDFGLDIAYNPKFLMETDPEFFRDNYLKEAAAKGYDVPSASDMTVDEFKAWMKTDKGIPAKESIAIQTSIVDTKLKRRKRGEPIDYEEALNAYSQYATSKNMEVTDGELAALRRGLDFLKDPESTPEAADLMYESFWGGALLGVTRSLPAILIPGGFITRTAAMYSQISSALEQEMAGDPDFQNISEAERFRLKLAIGSVSSVLEAVGLRNVLKQKGLLTGLLMKVLKKTPANVKGKAFNEVVMREVNSAIGRGALVVTSAGLAEFETGFLQEGVDIGFKNVYNEMKGRDMFETPEGARDIFGRMLYAGAQEAVGGFVLGTPGAISAARRSYDFTAVDDATFEMFENVSSQTARGELTYRHMFYTNLQARINRGEISKADAQQEMDNLDEVIAVNRDIPSDLTVSQKKKALGILLRKKDLQEQIEGKDPILVKRQQEELNSLNRELDQILYGTPETDAIQEQGPESVDAPEPTRDSEAVGEGVPDIGEPTTEVEAQDDVTDEAPAPTTEVAVDEAPTEKQQKGLQRRIDRSKKDFAAATSLEEKAKALVRYLNSVSNSKGIASEEDAAWYEANKAELEAEGFVFDDIGDELADGKPADIRNEETSDAVPKGKIIIKAVVKPGRVVDGKAVSRPTYDVIRGTGTTAARDALVAELKALEDELTTDNFNEISPKLKAARKALKDYDDANFPSSKSVAAPKKSAPKKTVSEPTQEVTEEVAVEETVPVEVEPVTAQSARYAQLIEDTPDSVVELFENWTKSLFSPEIEAIENKEPSNRTRSESAKLAAVTRRMKKALAAAEAAGLDNSAQIELERAVRERLETQEAAAVVAENVSEPTQEVTEEEQVDIDEFFGEQDIEGVEKVSENLVINRKQKAPTADPKSQRRMNRVRQMSVKAAASIRKIAPEVKILIHESPEEYQRFAGEQTAGNYNPKTKTIHINLGKANLYTAPHEVFHALLLQTISTDSEALTVSRKMLESVRKVVDPNSQMAKDIDEFVARYGDAPTIQDEEYLAQLTGILTAEYRTLNKPAKNAVKDFLRKLAKMLGLEKYLGPEFLKTDEQVIDLLNTISRRMSEGEYIEAADVKTMGDILAEATPAEQAQAQREVRDFKRKEREGKATEENLLNRSQEYVQDFDELERLNNEGVMFHFGPVDIQEVMPEKLRLMVSGYGIYFIDKAESPTTYSLYATRYGKRVTLVDGNGMNLVDSGSKISKEEFTTLMDTFNKEVAALDEVSPEITELSDYLNELDLDLQGANPTWYEMLTTMSPDLLPSDSDFFLGGVIDKAYNYTNPQKMFIAEVTAKALGYDGATSIIGKGSIEEHSVVNVWNFDKVNKNIISDEAVTPRQQIADIPQSAKNVLYGDSDVLPKPSKKKSNSQVAQELAEVAAEYYGGEIITSKTITPEQEETITEVGTEEAIAAFEDSGKSAADWYSTAIEKAMAVAAVIHPSLISKEEASKYEAFAKEKDPVAAANFAMRVALAITSQNLNVEANAKYANEQFDIFKKTGRFDASREYGTKAKSISSNLRLANVLVEKIGLNATEDFVLQEFNVSELEVAASKALGKNVKVSGLRNDKVNGAALFGPKIGQGFLQNLMGKFDPVTIDLWLRRTWGRWTGDVVGVGVKEERMARLLNGLKEAKKDTGVEVPDVMKKYRVVRKVRPSTGASYDTMSDKFISELEEDADFRDKIAAFAKTLSTKGDLMYKLIKNEPMSDGLYKAFISGEKTYGQTANQLQRIKDKLSAKYKDYVSKEKAKGRTPLKKSEWVKGQNQKDGRVNSPNNEAISARKPEWVKAATSITNDLKPIDIPTNQDRKVITRIVNDIKKRMTEQGYPVTNADVQALLWYPEKDIWAKLRGEEESNLKQSYDDQFIKIAEQKGLGKEAKSAAENVERERAAQPSGVDERKTDVGVSRLTDKEGVAPRQQLAPNGRPSNLNEEQYKIVRTPAFKKWFGDWENDPENASKVVDENGEPMVMYHGTSLSAKADIEINGFDSSKGRKGLRGFSFMSNKGLTKAYDKGAVLDVFLKLDNPMDFKKNFEIRDEIIERVAGKGIKEMTVPDWLKYTGEISREFEREAIKLGYDGVFDPNQPESKVFKNTNIKYADGSNKTFDPDSPSIRQQLSDIATPLPRQQKSVREVVQQARDNNFKDAATKDFLTRKGVPTADIDKAIKTLDDVYARVMKEIDGVITKSQKRGVDFDTQLKNALAYLQGTKLYEDTTDIHREKLMREVRAKFDKKEKRAPSAKRILGNIKDVKTVTLKEKEALKMQLRLVAKTAKTTARALVVAGNELTKSLKEMVKGGVITANQMSSVLRRFSRVDLFNPASIDSFLDYMAKIFADAEYGAKIARIKKLLPRAKKNIKSKIGVADVLGDTLTKLFNVNPTLIPMEMLEDYQNLLEMMGAAKKVLPLADINDVTEMANKLLNAVYEEVSMAEDLAEVFANYENKVIKDGKVDYAATVRAMIADETISEAEATVMIKYKSRIVESTTKEPKTEAELAEERAELMSAVDAAKVNVSRLVMDEERTLARQLAKLMRTEAIERLSNQQLETLLAVIDNINNGFVTHAANRLYVNMNALNNDNQLADSLQEADPLSISKFVAKIKGGITQNNKFFEAIKRRPLAYIDSLFGDFKTNRIYNSVFRPLAKAFDSMNVEIQRIEERLDNAENAVRKSFKRNPNKVRLSSYKRMTYMLQREFEANPDNGQVNPAADFIRATIDHINEGKSFFKGRDAEMLQQILDDFGVSVKDADGNEVIQIDSQKLYDSFNKAERNAIVVAEDINKSLASKASFTAAVIQGRRADILNQYAHHNVLSSSEQADKSTSISEIQKYNQSLRASTKAKNSIERTGAVTPLNFDVLTSVSRGAKMMLTDFYLTDPVRTSRKTISNTRKVLEERGNATKQDKEILNAIDQALELALDDVLTKTFTQGTMVDNIIQYISKTGYRVVLASVSRFGAEGLSNSGFVSLFAPKQMALGLSKDNMKLSIGSGGTAVDILSALGSTQISRLFPDQMLSGRMIDTSVLGEKSGDKGGRAYGEVANKMLQIYNGVVKPGKEGVERVADGLISTPDKAVIRPLWFGSFEYKFEELTKKKPDMDKIAANDEAYMDANQKALDEATDYADQMTTFAGAADNPFKGLLKGKYPSSVKQSAMLQAFNISNSFMTRFLIYEFISAQIGTYAMMGRGMISKRQGAALLGAVATRMVVYTLLTTLFAQIFKQAFGLGDEEDEKDIEKQFGQALASTAVSLIVGRDFGNIVKGLLNYGVENLNEEFLDELRDGDYDPYRDAIAYTFIPPDKEYKSNTLADYIRNLMGPFGPFYKMAEFGVKTLSADEKKDPAARIRQQRELNERLPLELLGNLGLIPLYRDIRALLLADIYKGMGKDKKGSGTGMTKAEKAQMKEYFPELYKMQMQMEEDMKNPELEKFEKEMKLLEKQLEESLKQR